MSRREDETLQRLTGRHPAACTCQDCNDKFLKKKKIKPQRGWPGRNWAVVDRAAAKKVAEHPTDCACASCVLLGSLENLPQLDRGPKGFLKRLLGKR